MKKIFLLVALVAFILTNSFAQQGYLLGRVLDDDLGEGLIGTNIYVEGTTNGSVADFNGDYSLSLEPGTYTIVFSSISYAIITVSEVKIIAGEVTSLDLSMKSDVEQLDAVVVTADVIKNSEAGLLAAQKRAINIADGISNQTFKKVGDADLSGAIKRVTGVSVEDGKYVYVRGLGDRYTKTTLNGMSIPGLDPDKNSVQIDIFPTAVLDNVMVYKTFTPNLYGDFTGGIVDIETKEFPEQNLTSLSVGLSMTPGVQFNNDFILYKGGSTDWLGFDDGTRALPFDKNTVIPVESRIDPDLERLTRSFNPQMGAQKRTALPSGSLTFNTGNQFDRENLTFGYNVVLNYQNTFELFSNVQSNNFLKDPDASKNELFKDENRKGVLGRQTATWSALGSGAIKFGRNSLSLSILRSQSGESVANQRVNRNFNQTGATLLEDILTYTQRSVTNGIIIGKHDLEKIKLEWRGALNWSRVYDPDFRVTSISITDGDTSLNVGDGAGINRFYRDLNEFNGSFKADFTLPYATKSKFKFGGIGLYKNRDFEILNYFFRVRGGGANSDPDWYLKEENIWTANERMGTYVVGNFEPTNAYNARQTIISAYAMTELYVSPQLKTIFGVRAEQSSMFYTGQTNSGDKVYNDVKTLDELDILPSLNIVYAIGENSNLRGSYNRTLARPSFKEKSIAQIYDPLTNRTFIGNIDLLQTNVDNYDLRWELYMKPGEVISVSGFYKSFYNHIEMVSFPVDPDALKPRNAPDSWVYGLEFEIRKNLDFIAPALTNLTVGANFSLIRSFVDMNSIFVDNSKTKTEKVLRQENARDGEVIGDTRGMAGQAPYLVNAYVNYFAPTIDININVAYNVQGETLSVVGTGLVPDVYSVPFHSLSFNAYKGFGGEKKSRVSFGVDNILNDVREQVYQSYQSSDQIYSTYNHGTRYSLKYSYTF
ncbi:MAG: TonB-dependent receptor [Bacteroidetes bacterium]|nr:MAG: TonB-dependent receptor [Bacteroidota bacterium]